MPVSSVRRLSVFASSVGGIPARRASTRAAISLSTFSRNDATTASLYSGPSPVYLGGGADFLWRQWRVSHMSG